VIIWDWGEEGSAAEKILPNFSKLEKAEYKLVQTACNLCDLLLKKRPLKADRLT
jgi:hypothetical protein